MNVLCIHTGLSLRLWDLNDSKFCIFSGSCLTYNLHPHPRNCSFLRSCSLLSFMNVTLTYVDWYSARLKDRHKCISGATSLHLSLLLVSRFTNSNYSSLSELQSLWRQLSKTAGLCLDSYSLCHNLKMPPGIKPGQL